MFNARAKQQLEALRDRLASWQGQVPQRARRFQELRGELLEQVRLQLSPWRRLWIADEELDRLDERVRLLTVVAGPLALVVGRAEEAETELRQLGAVRADDRTDGDHPEPMAWLDRHRRQWSTELQLVGAASYRSIDVERDRATVAAIEEQVRRLDQALTWWREAARVLGILGAKVEAARLRAELPELERELESAGATDDWLRRIRGLVQPLQPLASRVKDPPVELQTVSQLLTELHGWSQQLEAVEERVIALEARRRLAVDWTKEQIEALAGEARALRDELVERAGAQRDAHLAELTDQLADLVQAVGPQPELQRRLEALTQQPVDRYQLFRDWTVHLDQLRNFFLATANNHESALEKRRDELAEALRQRLEQVRKGTLSDEVVHRIAALEVDLRDLEKASGAEHLLVALRARTALEAQIAKIDAQAALDLAQLEQQVADLGRREEELRQLGAEVGVATLDLRPRFDGLRQPWLSFEAARRLAADLGHDLEAGERQYVERCHELVAELRVRINAALDALRRAGRPLAGAAPPELDATAPPRRAADAVIGGMGIDQELSVAVKRANAAFEAQRRQAQAHLERLPREALGPEDREQADQLAEELATATGAKSRGPLQRLEVVSRVLRRYDDLAERLLQEERTARERRKALRQRLQRFAEEQLRRHCPELTDRVGALVYGIPEEPPQWRAVHHQLDIAESLFARVEAQAKQLAADELGRAVRTIAERLRAADAGSAAGARGLLAEIEALEHQELPPVNLRLRALDLARRPGAGELG